MVVSERVYVAISITSAWQQNIFRVLYLALSNVQRVCVAVHVITCRFTGSFNIRVKVGDLLLEASQLSHAQGDRG